LDGYANKDISAANIDTNEYRNKYADVDAYPDFYGHANGSMDAHDDTVLDTHSNADLDANPDQHTDADADGY
jgi:hypothetical protein